MKYLLSFTLLISTLIARESNVATGGDPSALIAGHVNVLTGQFIEQRHDLLLPGPNPIYLDSFFSSYLTGHDFGGKWRVLPHVILKKERNKEVIEWCDHHGSKLTFNVKRDDGIHVYLPEEMTNTSAGRPSGQNDIRNIRVKKVENEVYRVELGDGRLLFYRKYKSDPKWIYFALERERKRNGWWLHYKFHHAQKRCVITNKNPKEEGDYGWVSIRKNSSQIIVTTPYGTHTHVQFKRSDEKNPFPQEVTPDFANKQAYYYNHINSKQRQVECIDNEQGHQLNFEYFAEDYPDKALRSKVRLIKLPVDKDHPALRFSYHIDGTRSGAVRGMSHSTIDYPDKGKTTYHFNRTFIPHRIERYKNNKIATQEKFIWEFDDCRDRLEVIPTLLHTLIGKVMCDGDQPILDTRYEYDAGNNIKAEHIHGNLTGEWKKPFKLSSEGRIVGHADLCTVEYEYTTHNRLLKKLYPTGDYEIFTYHGDTHLPKEHKVYNFLDEIVSLVQYSYDENNLCTQIDDNGIVTKMWYDNFANLTKIDGPDGVSEFEYKAYKMVAKTENGLRTTYRYDSHLNCIEEKNKHIFIQRFYDARDFLEWESCNGIKTEYKYDKAGRLKSQTHANRTTRYEYDLKSRKTLEVDHRGVKTKYTYDQLDNLTEVHIEGRLVQKFEYDNFGNCTAQYDGNENRSTTTYGSLNQPLTHTDACGNTIEKKYDLRGRVVEEKYSNGKVVYTGYDELDRPVGITTNNDRVTTNEYKGKHLVKQTVNGLSATFSYDKKGRLKTKKFGDKIFTYTYDDSNRILSEDQNGLQTHYTYDPLGQVLSEKVICKDKIYSHVEHEYDQHQNLIEKHHHTATRVITHKYEYDELKRLKSHTTPDGQTTKYFYTDFTKTAIAPNGVKTIETFDEWDNLKQLEKYDGDTLLLSETFIYDNANQKIEQHSKIIRDGKLIKTHTTKWEYDPCGNCTKIAEGERITHMTYEHNRLATVTKPKGVISYQYDELDNLTQVTASEIDYTTEYDKFNRPINVTDGQERVYDNYGNITREILANGLTIEREFDLHDRPTKLTLHDGTTIEYIYEGPHLKYVKRGELTHTYEAYDSLGVCTKQLPMDNLPPISLHLDDAGRSKERRYGEYSHSIERNEEGSVTSSLTQCTQNFTSQFSYDKLNQLTKETYPIEASYEPTSHHTITDHTLDDASYDDNGNCIALRDATFAYDALDRLILLKTPAGETRFTYDSLNRMMTINDEEKLYYDNAHEIGSYKKNKAILLRVLGSTPYAEIGAAVLLETPYSHSIPIHDLYGNTMALIENKTATQFSLYSAYGIPITIDPHDYEIDSQIPYAYQGKREHQGFISFGRRFYDPETHTFLNPDPKGLSFIPNPYHYLANNPLMHHDPWGLEEAISRADLDHSIDLLTSGRGNEINFKPLDLARQLALYHNEQRAAMPPHERNRLTPSRYNHIPRLHDGAIRMDLGLSEMPGRYNIHVGGILSDLVSMRSNALYKSEMLGGYNVHVVANHTKGFLNDLRRAKRTIQDGDIGEAGLFLIAEIFRGLQHIPVGVNVKIDPHSEGVALVRAVLEMLPYSVRDRLSITEYNAAAHISPGKVNRLSGFCSKRDYVPWLDLSGRMRADYLVSLTPHVTAENHDHGFQSPTLRGPMKLDNRDYMKTGI